MDFLGGFYCYVQQSTLQSGLPKPAKKSLEVYTQMDFLGGFDRYVQQVYSAERRQYNRSMLFCLL